MPGKSFGTARDRHVSWEIFDDFPSVIEPNAAPVRLSLSGTHEPAAESVATRFLAKSFMTPSFRETEELLLVQAAQRGDHAALAILIERYDRRLVYYVRRLLGESEETVDVMQSVWLQVHRQLRGLRAPQAFRVWLFRLVHDQAVSELRRKGLRPTRLDEDPANIPDTRLEPPDESLDNRELVHRALGRLSLEHRQVLTLRFLEEMTVEEIAEVTGLPSGTVKSRLYYARLAIRTHLEELSHGSIR